MAHSHTPHTHPRHHCRYVGAAAFSAGCTQTISTGIAVLEMTGEMDFAIPVMLAVVLSVLVSSKLTSSIFDRISKLNGLPNIHLPRCDITEKVRLSPRHSYQPKENAARSK
jgi:H+/Cl- antiporter ClcA